MASKRSIWAGTPAGLVGVVSAVGLGACEGADACEGQRTFDPPPAPESSPNSPPSVDSGEWIGAGVLELQFSKPLAAGNAPDPARFALLGWSAQAQAYDAYQGSDQCYLRTGYGLLRVGYYQTTISDVWVAPEDPSVLRLRMSNLGAACLQGSDILAEGVMLVYANADSDPEGPPIGAKLLDDAGDPVPDLGPMWAIQSWEDCLTGANNYYYNCGYSLNRAPSGHLPSITSLAPIPCP